MSAVEDYLSREPRRLEIPFQYRGSEHYMIARENNDGEAICYVYVLTAEQNKQKPGQPYEYPEIELSNGNTEMILGMHDIQDLESRVQLLDATWITAQEEARRQVGFLQKHNA